MSAPHTIDFNFEAAEQATAKVHQPAFTIEDGRNSRQPPYHPKVPSAAPANHHPITN
jgi:hypothetical protein